MRAKQAHAIALLRRHAQRSSWLATQREAGPAALGVERLVFNFPWHGAPGLNAFAVATLAHIRRGRGWRLCSRCKSMMQHEPALHALAIGVARVEAATMPVSGGP
jgi:hypothetical protein